jgi:hypothetical protein
MRKKRVSPELATFWEEIENFGRNLVPGSMTPEMPRTPEELNTRAKRATTMGLKKAKVAGQPARKSKA